MFCVSFPLIVDAVSGSSSPHHVTPFSPSRTPRFPKHKPSPMDSTYADLAQQVSITLLCSHYSKRNNIQGW